MVITRLEKEDGIYCPAAESGTAITLGTKSNSLTVDAAEHYGMEQGIVDVFTHGPGEPLTLDGSDTAGGIYNVATIVIPAQKVELIEADTEIDEQTGEEKMVVKAEAQPLDMAAVQITLWPLPFDITAPAKTTTETTATEAAEKAQNNEEEA